MKKLPLSSYPLKVKNFIVGALLLGYLIVSVGYAQDYPKRIISLSTTITEEIYILGIEDKLVGCTLYCQRPAEAKNKEKVGTVMRMDLEKVISLKPDLVLTGSLSNPGQIERLKNLGIKIISFSSPNNFSGICEQFLELGKITGREETAEEFVEEVKEKVKNLKKKNKGLSKPKVFIQIGVKPLFTVTEDSFINDFIEFAGGINIAENVKTGQYSREEVLRKNPDLIIIVTMGILGEQEKEIWTRYKTLNAVKNNRIHIIDSYKLCSPTPISFVETLEEIMEILHPSIEQQNI